MSCRGFLLTDHLGDQAGICKSAYTVGRGQRDALKLSLQFYAPAVIPSAGKRRKIRCMEKCRACEYCAVKWSVRNTAGLEVGGPAVWSRRDISRPGFRKGASSATRSHWEVAPAPWGPTQSVGREAPSAAREGSLGNVPPWRRQQPDLSHLLDFGPSSSPLPCHIDCEASG